MGDNDMLDIKARLSVVEAAQKSDNAKRLEDYDKRAVEYDERIARKKIIDSEMTALRDIVNTFTKQFEHVVLQMTGGDDVSSGIIYKVEQIREMMSPIEPPKTFRQSVIDLLLIKSVWFKIIGVVFLIEQALIIAYLVGIIPGKP